MVFSSIVFLLYFLPLFLLVYFLSPKKMKNLVILLGSFVFYWWGAPLFIYVILGTTALDFLLVNRLWKSNDPKTRLYYLLLSVSINLGLLFYFKYSNFFIENVNAILGTLGSKEITWTKLVLPIGISFYTFETITYVVDVYRKKHEPVQQFSDYLLYILFFPKLIAGPIVRFHEIADQINNRFIRDTYEQRLHGFYRLCLGLAKKVLIANQLAVYAEPVFTGDLTGINSYTAWMGILAFTFQLYFDFSGYSDMGLGIAQMLGFKLPENFNNPYTASSITDFWRRWHITLGTWMKNYLYIPLGGNKVNSQSRLYLNLALVFLASGLWHGASWSFILWGAYHGTFLILERIFLADFYKKIGRLPSTILCFFIVVIGWVFFKIENIDDAMLFVHKLFLFEGASNSFFDFQFFFFLTLAAFFSYFTFFKIGEKIQNKVYFQSYSLAQHISMSLLCIVLFAIAVSFIAAADFNPFIYYRF